MKGSMDWCIDFSDLFLPKCSFVCTIGSFPFLDLVKGSVLWEADPRRMASIMMSR